MAQDDTFSRYLSRWWKAAFAPAYDAFGWVGVLVGFALWIWHRFWSANFQWAVGHLGISPENAMSDLVWAIPLGLGVCVLAYRLLRAPYEMHFALEATTKAALQLLRSELEQEQRRHDPKAAPLGQRIFSRSSRAESSFEKCIPSVAKLPVPISIRAIVPAGSVRAGQGVGTG